MSTVQMLNEWEAPPKRTNGKASGYYAETIPSFVLNFRPVIDMTDDEFFVFCQANRDLRIERNADGEVLIMPLTGWETGKKNALITAELTHWARIDKSGVTTDSSGGYKLPNGATRAPDAAWIRKTRLAQLTKAQKQKFLPLAPDFVIELRSPSDGLKELQDKMTEYMENGVQLGWLIDPLNHCIYIYHQDAVIECLQAATAISGDPLLPGFVLELTELWEMEE